MKRTPLNLEEPAPLSMTPIKWIVITRENYQEIFDELEKNNTDVVLFGLTDEGYEELVINFAQVRKYIILNRHILMKYKEYYEGDEDGKAEETPGK